jgi:hypothetical protein
MKGKLTLYVDQYGNKYYAYTLKELKERHYIPGKVSKMYVDGKDGKTYHIGYVIGQFWLKAYRPIRQEVVNKYTK